MAFTCSAGIRATAPLGWMRGSSGSARSALASDPRRTCPSTVWSTMRWSPATNDGEGANGSGAVGRRDQGGGEGGARGASTPCVGAGKGGGSGGASDSALAGGGVASSASRDTTSPAGTVLVDPGDRGQGDRRVRVGQDLLHVLRCDLGDDLLRILNGDRGVGRVGRRDGWRPGLPRGGVREVPRRELERHLHRPVVPVHPGRFLDDGIRRGGRAELLPPRLLLRREPSRAKPLVELAELPAGFLDVDHVCGRRSELR